MLLMAGNHGDEYEGEICLAKLSAGLICIGQGKRHDTAHGKHAGRDGRPALLASGRGNLNRAFPGSSNGTPTSRLAHFLESELFPRHDIVFDLHSGGTSMEHLLTALVERNDDPRRNEEAIDLMMSLGIPHAFVADNGPHAPTSMGAARRAGSIGISGEFGGGGTATVDSVAATARAIDRLLINRRDRSARAVRWGRRCEATQLLSLARHSQGIYASGADGSNPRSAWETRWKKARLRVGIMTSNGSRSEQPLRFAEGGIVISRRLHTMCEAGDCLVQAAEPMKHV